MIVLTRKGALGCLVCWIREGEAVRFVKRLKATKSWGTVIFMQLSMLDRSDH